MDSKKKALVVGGFLGALLGVAAALLYLRVAEESEEERVLSSGKALKLGLSILSIFHQIATIGGRGKRKLLPW